MLETQRWKTGTENRKSLIVGWRLEAGGWRLEAGGWRLEAGYIKPDTVDRHEIVH
jgi:hypothetical protein